MPQESRALDSTFHQGLGPQRSVFAMHASEAAILCEETYASRGTICSSIFYFDCRKLRRRPYRVVSPQYQQHRSPSKEVAEEHEIEYGHRCPRQFGGVLQKSLVGHTLQFVSNTHNDSRTVHVRAFAAKNKVQLPMQPRCQQYTRSHEMKRAKHLMSGGGESGSLARSSSTSS